jgi:hypothetical protein
LHCLARHFAGLLVAHAVFHQNPEPSGPAVGLMLFSSFFFVLVPSFLLANLTSWLIKPVWRANCAAIEGLSNVSLSKATKDLLKMGAVLLPVYGVVAVVGIWAR